VFSNKVKPAVFEVYDISGNKLLSKNLSLQNGLNTFEFKLNTNAKMIIVQLNSEGNKQTKKIFY
jgi:myo-inositol-hexaphosphate 3-phosphohydrolase